MGNASVIVSVYKKTKELELVLYALSVQTHKNYEIIIADDGSGEEISKIVQKFRNILSNKIILLTQADKGFRKNKILNESIRKSKTDYLIFIDGDCIPHSEFVKVHIDNIEENTALCGRRVLLGKELSSSITKENILSLKYQKIGTKHLLDAVKNSKDSSRNLEEGLLIKRDFLRKPLRRKDVHIMGCNFSLHKELIKKINGFDESYIGPGIGEDSDLEFRLGLLGTKFKSIRNLAIQYHLYHEKTIEERKNYDYFQKVKEKNNYLCSNGLNKLG
jgi:glycosyltransferase involved in cell wall biosynthesis